jgi:hypothetical protein
LAGVAVKVTLEPAHTVYAGAAMVTAGITVGRIVIFKAGEVTLAGVAHVALEVMMQETVWPLVRVLVAYVGLFVPTMVVPIFH